MEYKFRIVKAFTIFTEKGVLNGFGEYGYLGQYVRIG